MIIFFLGLVYKVIRPIFEKSMTYNCLFTKTFSENVVLWYRKQVYELEIFGFHSSEDIDCDKSIKCVRLNI